MKSLKHVSNLLKTSKEIQIDDSSKIIIMSDCHRGVGDWTDSFAKNQNIYFSALNYYYNNNYSYIELGDGDELWENTRMSDILIEHSDVFWLLCKFYKANRFHWLYGNHDMIKKEPSFVENNLNHYYNEWERIEPLFDDINITEGLVLKYKDYPNKILLIHGHQVDFLNNNLWKLSRFLVRFLWRPLESLGINDRTRTAKNYKKGYNVAKTLKHWVVKEKHILIAGHNHRPEFPELGDIPYFNDGSCVHPRCITGIEINDGNIVLVKWSIKTNEDGILFIGRDILGGPQKLEDYFRLLPFI